MRLWNTQHPLATKVGASNTDHWITSSALLILSLLIGLMGHK
jgi:hypothetical protein